MRLKSLELNGFKSFANKTSLEFPKGITGIVGPNGSGKSNIIDAIRWILGEREAKNLRGARAEDLIFNGTSKRPRAGMAKVELHFDNEQGFFPVDFKEITTKREVSRDGLSRYFLNKSEVRLKDIVDFWARSRLGIKGLIIINQGNSDLFVRVSPEERKVMIEEILGLREYQIKKLEAERKLKNTYFNLDKAKALIEEVAPRLRLLRRQAGKWGKRAELKSELRNLEDKYFSFRLKEIESQNNKTEPDILFVKKQIKERNSELLDLEENLEKIESERENFHGFEEIRKLQPELAENRFKIQREISRLEAKMEVLNNSNDENFKTEELVLLLNDIRNLLVSAIEQTEYLKKSKNEAIKKIDDFFNRPRQAKLNDISGLEELKDGLIENLKEIENKLIGIEEEQAKAAKFLEEFNAKFKSAVELIEFKKEELRNLDGKKSRILFDKEKMEIKLSEIESQIFQAERNLKEFRPETAISLSDEEVSETERKMFKIRAELAGIGEIDESLIKESQETESHYNFLTKQSEDLGKAAIDLKNLIKELNQRIHDEFNKSFKLINEEFNNFFKLMFGGGHANLKIKKQSFERLRAMENEENLISENGDEEKEESFGIEIEMGLPQKRITSLEVLSGGEKSLVSIAALFALVSVSPPPFLVLDEIDAALDENNSKRFSNLIGEFSKKTQFIIVTHNRATMESADVLYGVTLGEDGTSKILSLKLDKR